MKERNWLQRIRTNYHEAAVNQRIFYLSKIRLCAVGYSCPPYFSTVFLPRNIFGIYPDVTTVSYTHLDVYKRQVKEGVVIIDVGTTRVPDATKKSGFKLTGDVKFDEVAPKCSFITPVPGGVGPMTIVSLMRNTLLAGKKAIYP